LKDKIPKESGEITRREFLKDAGLVVGGAAIGSTVLLAACGGEETTKTVTKTQTQTVTETASAFVCPFCSEEFTSLSSLTSHAEAEHPAEIKPWLPDKWDKEADIVVLGQGAAGIITAITAHDLGAEVLILEKASEDHAGGNSLTNYGGLFFTRDPDTAFPYIQRLNWSATPDDVIRVFLERITEQEKYYEDMGFPIAPDSINVQPEFPEVEGSEAIMWGKAGNGELFMEVFMGHIKDRGIEVLYETPAKKLIQDAESGEILGVVAEHNGSKMYVKAKKAVAICTGGFEYNEEMRKQYLHAPFIPSVGAPYCTGDGILMAQDVGADLWHMAFFADCKPGFKAPDCDHTIGLSIPGNRFIYLDKYGERYICEKYPYRHGYPQRPDYLYFDPDKVEYPRIPTWIVTDETGRTDGRWGPTRKSESGWAARRGYVWSEDNSVEIAKGWVLKGDTLSDLAVKMAVDSAVLSDTIAKWNKDCEEGEDSDFGRDPGTMIKIETPPYYAIEMGMYFLNTQGGPRRNAKSQILDTGGKPIPRLYVAGECGSVCGMIYQSSENMAECFVFGQVVAENAVKETSWT